MTKLDIKVEIKLEKWLETHDKPTWMIEYEKKTRLTFNPLFSELEKKWVFSDKDLIQFGVYTQAGVYDEDLYKKEA